MVTRDIKAVVEKVVWGLMSAIQIRNIYGKEHNLTKDSITALYSKLNDALSERSEITIGVIGDEIAFEKEPFYEISRNIGNFISRLKKMKIEKISFLKGVTRAELTDFLDLLSENARAAEKDGGAAKALESRGITGIIIGTIGAPDERPAPPADSGTGYAEADASFEQGLGFLRKISADISESRPVDMAAARFVVTKIVGNLLRNVHSFLILSSLKKRDEGTFVHSINVAIFTLVQAEALGIGEDLLADIGIAALLHDTGKLVMEAHIIKKAGKLNAQEAEKIKSHPIDGAEILLETPDVPLLAALSSFEHHMKYDVQGYPERLYGNKINVVSMMITIADVYDALRSKRSYHEPLPPEKVYEQMTELSEKNFHPLLLDIFFRRIGVYPPGTLVELDNNAIGLVVKESSLEMRRPQVEILYNPKGEREKEPYFINLLEKDNGTKKYKWTIVRSVPFSEKYDLPDKYKTG
ncbi:MAG: HD domain-containing phosphohydrolase [Candidatus Omnitrophota bacterium]